MVKLTLRYEDNNRMHVFSDGDFEIMIGIIRGHYVNSMALHTPDWNNVFWTITRNSDNIRIAQGNASALTDAGRELADSLFGEK